MKRNEKATCGSCPYYYPTNNEWGYCRIHESTSQEEIWSKDYWCGQHPDFSDASIPQGWECPRCHKINAPWITNCDCRPQYVYIPTSPWITISYGSETP